MSNPDSNEPMSASPWWRSPSMLYAIIPVGLVVFLAYALLWPEKVIQPLSDVSSARGVITFIICLTTAGIALALTLHIALGDRNDLKERFDFGKQVLSTFVGILGTIVGFYFGSTVTGAAAVAGTLKFTTARISPPAPKAGESMTISLSILGGKAPYTYSIAFSDRSFSEVKDSRSEDGLIVQDVEVPAKAIPGSQVTFKIVVADSEGRKATYNDDGKQSLSLQPASQALPDVKTGT